MSKTSVEGPVVLLLLMLGALFCLAYAAYVQLSKHPELASGRSHLKIARRTIEKQVKPLRDQIFPDDIAGYVPNILAGLIAGLKIVLGMITFANISWMTCRNAKINAMFPTGVNINLMSASVFLGTSMFASSINVPNAPQDTPAIIYSQLAEVLPRVVKDPNKLAHTFLACMWISSIAIGALMFILGRCQAGQLFRKIPSPVCGGFISSCGAIAIRSAMEMITGVEFQGFHPTSFRPFRNPLVWAELALAIFTLFCIRALSPLIKPCVGRVLKPIVNPCCTLLPLMLFYAVLVLRGNVFESLQNLQAIGWVYPSLEPAPFYAVWEEVFSFGLVEWSALGNGQIIGLFIVNLFLSTLDTVMVMAACSDIPVIGAINLNSELESLGLQNLGVGLLGGSLGYQQLGLSIPMIQDGGSHRLAVLVAGMFVTLVFLSGFPVSQFIPKFYLGGVFFNLGVDFCKHYLVDKYKEMDKGSYCSMVLVVIVAISKDLLHAVFLGILLQVGILLVLSSTISPVYLHTDMMVSSRARAQDQYNRLANTNHTDVLRVRGPLFFGVAEQLVLRVESLLNEMEPVPMNLILDLVGVTALDATALQSFGTILGKCDKRRVLLCLVGNRDMRWMFARARLVSKQNHKGGIWKRLRPKLPMYVVDDLCCDGCGSDSSSSVAELLELMDDKTPIEHVRSPRSPSLLEHLAPPAQAFWFETLDEALALCEDNFLSIESGHDAGTLKTPQDLVHSVQWEVLNNMKTFCEKRKLNFGELLYSQGDSSAEFFLVEDGQIEIFMSSTSSSGRRRRIRTATPPVLVGATQPTIRCMSRVNSARVSSVDGAIVYALQPRQLDALKEFNMGLYVAFTENLLIPSLLHELGANITAEH